jgi:hypothetical protein
VTAKPKISIKNGAVQATNVPPNKVSPCSTLTDAQESVIREIISRATDKCRSRRLASLPEMVLCVSRDGLVMRTVTV